MSFSDNNVPIIRVSNLFKEKGSDLLPQTFNVDLPQTLVDQILEAKDPQEIKEIGIDFCIKQVKELLDANVPGVHFYTQSRAEPVKEVVKATF